MALASAAEEYIEQLEKHARKKQYKRAAQKRGRK